MKDGSLLQRNDWDSYFMTMAYLVSMKSKDPSTRVGSVIVGHDNEIIATGYNGLPRGILDLRERYYNKEFKHLTINHAEENAILHCARIGVSAKGCKIYVPWVPCSRCTKSIIQAGLIEVIYDANFPGNIVKKQSDEWKNSVEISRIMLEESKIKLRAFKGNLIKIEGLYQGEKIKL